MFNFIFKQVRRTYSSPSTRHIRNSERREFLLTIHTQQTAFLRAIDSWLKNEKRHLTPSQALASPTLALLAIVHGVWVVLYLVHGHTHRARRRPGAFHQNSTSHLQSLLYEYFNTSGIVPSGLSLAHSKNF